MSTDNTPRRWGRGLKRHRLPGEEWHPEPELLNHMGQVDPCEPELRRLATERCGPDYQVRSQGFACGAEGSWRTYVVEGSAGYAEIWIGLDGASSHVLELSYAPGTPTVIEEDL